LFSKVNLLLFSFKLAVNPWPESASELYWPSDRCMSVKLVPTFVERGCHAVSVTDSYSHIISFLVWIQVLEQGLKMWHFFCSPILFAVCTSTFSKLCKNLYNGLQNTSKF
jgi:hypothetical protein